MAQKGDLRISDSDREAAADEIRAHYAAGRLDSDELDQRLHAVYAAKIESELKALFSDLPKLGRASAARHELALERARPGLPARVIEGA
ncbi:MAG TPA: DUF1707 domain-containing protein, partial [Solirubrobacteraceae bacterium]|nr:DUF1707 domain-containing protein [Solirubrobacteraceae bacterium]